MANVRCSQTFEILLCHNVKNLDLEGGGGRGCTELSGVTSINPYPCISGNILKKDDRKQENTPFPPPQTPLRFMSVIITKPMNGRRRRSVLFFLPLYVYSAVRLSCNITARNTQISYLTYRHNFCLMLYL
jgi:hypothetical protein